ncbi:MAG: sugar phosphate isomerase/epimerase [Clostridia bacterium]|nr:sugar phosphate isomerase/epimerase [Clostridia bacterium]
MSRPLYVSSGAFIGRGNGFSPDGFFSVCREYDCEGFEFMMYRAWYPELDGMLARFRESGVRFPTFHCDKTIGEGFSSGDPDEKQNALVRFRENCRAAATLGSRLLVLHLWNGLPSDRNVARHIDALADLYEIAAEYDLLLTVENVICADRDPLTHFDSIARRYPAARFTFDTKMAAFHDQMGEITSPDRRDLAKRIAHVHLNDYGGGVGDFSDLRVLHLGEGKIDFAPFLALLSEIDYSGAVTLECSCFSSLDGTWKPEKMHTSLERARTMLAQ